MRSKEILEDINSGVEEFKAALESNLYEYYIYVWEEVEHRTGMEYHDGSPVTYIVKEQIAQTITGNYMSVAFASNLYVSLATGYLQASEDENLQKMQDNRQKMAIFMKTLASKKYERMNIEYFDSIVVKILDELESRKLPFDDLYELVGMLYQNTRECSSNCVISRVTSSPN